MPVNKENMEDGKTMKSDKEQEDHDSLYWEHD